MCGIIAYLGNADAVERVTDGLKTLEYRGYDSAGLAFINNGIIKTIKQVGYVDALIKKTAEISPPKTDLAIGHTRWATHGGISEVNSHPHVSSDGSIAVAHNGIIENYLDIKKDLESAGMTFQSTTDTEVIPNLIALYVTNAQGRRKEFLDSVIDACKYLKGWDACLAI
jgi:glucosamine--fructose-6-phosphate aminotransferase (isomerizing)